MSRYHHITALGSSKATELAADVRAAALRVTDLQRTALLCSQLSLATLNKMMEGELGPFTGAGIGGAGGMHFFGAGDYDGASICQHDPPRWNPPFPPQLQGVLTQAEWNDFFRGLNKVSSDNVDPQCGCCPKSWGGISGSGWKRAIEGYLNQINAKYAGRILWSYQSHSNGQTTVHNRLDIGWQPMAVAAPAVQGVEREATVINTIN